MPNHPHYCVDRILPQDLRRQQRTRMVGGRSRAIALAGKQWVNGSTIRIELIGGTDADRSLVQSVAPQWTQHANLHFDFTNDPTSQIRVTFNETDGAWSYVGTDNSQIPLNQATLNLGWVDEGVILHEFGHMIGLSHEHQNPDGGIIWNEEAVIDDLSGPPNNWDEATIRHNVLDKYTVDQVLSTDFDSKSIMLYEFPADWTQNMAGTTGNEVLSQKDINFIKSAEMYPGASSPVESAVEIQVGRHNEADLSQPNEEDLYTFKATEDGIHTIETHGSTDLVMSLFGPNDMHRLIGNDDDSGTGLNARIRAQLSEGTYYVRIRHYSDHRTGAYRIGVNAH